MTISRSQMQKQLVPGLNAIFGTEYASYAGQHLELFDKESSERAFEEEVLQTGFRNASVKPEGAYIEFDESQESYVVRYTHVTYGLAFSITEEAIEDNLYADVGKRNAKFLARSLANTKEIVHSNIFNNGFSSSFKGGDGVSLFNTAHPLVNGATASNKPSVDVDLSEAALEQGTIDVQNFVDDRGIYTASKTKRLAVPRGLEFVANRILKSALRVGTADNDLNALKEMGMFPGGIVVNSYFTDANAWFILTDCPDGLKTFQRRPYKTSTEGDFETGNFKYKATERYSVGWSDWRGAYGSSGAS